MKLADVDKSGVISNIIVVEPNSIPEWAKDWPEVTNEGIGWVWNGSVFEKPVSVVTAEEVRAKRNQLLAESDWTQVADAPVDQTAWATYRQELRDITEQSGFPTDVIWPVAPN